MVNVSATLYKTLQARSAEDLTYIAEAWAIGEAPTRGWIENVKQLGEKMQGMISARFAWEGLSKDAREILHQMITLAIMDGIPHEDVQKLTRLTDATFTAALTELEQRLMLVEERPGAKARASMETRGQQFQLVLAIPKELRELFTAIDYEMTTPNGDRSQLKLVDLLATYKITQLQEMMQHYDPDSYSPYYAYTYDSTGLAKSLAGKLMQVNKLTEVWAKLDPVAQKLCQWLCQAGGTAEFDKIRIVLNLSNPILSNCLHLLESYGLVFETFSGQERKVFIARGVLKVLSKTIGETNTVKVTEKQQKKPTLEALQEAPPIVHEAEGQLLYDLAITVGATYQQTIEPTQAGRIPKRLANKIFPLLHGSRLAYYEEEDHYLDMVFSIALHLELIILVENTGQKARYLPGPKLADWAGLQPYEQVRLLLDLWWIAPNHFWGDMAGARYSPDHVGHYLDMRAARKALTEYIVQECRPGQWYTLAAFLQTIKECNPLLLRPPTHSHGNPAYIRKVILANWDFGDSQIIAGILASSLHELGIVTIGYQQAEERGQSNISAFQLTELAATVFGRVQANAESTTPPQHTLIVQPNFELLLLQPDFPTLYQLLPFAKVNQVEMVSRLTLTQESVRRGIEAGWSVERSLQTLQEQSQKDLPQNIIYTMQDWARFYKDATVSQVLLLEVSNEAVADEMCASAKFRTLELRRLGPCAILVGGQTSLQVLRTTLEKEGVILRVQGEILTGRETAATPASSSYYSYGRSR